MNPTYYFEGQVALIKGAGSGTGAATAKAFKAAGARVVLVDRDATKLGAVAGSLAVAGSAVPTHVGDASNEMFASAVVGDTVVAFASYTWVTTMRAF